MLPKPYYHDEQYGIKIFLGDCRTILPYLDPVDLVVTSPPYNNWRNRRTQANRSDYWKRTNVNYGEGCDDAMPDEEYENAQVEIINLCLAGMKDTGTICYNHKDRIFEFESVSPLRWIYKSNAIVRQRVTWDRGGMQAYNPVRFYRVEEDIYILGKVRGSGFVWNKDCAKYLSVWKVAVDKRDGGHPAPMTKEIATRCINSFSLPDAMVLDPYIGSGTTLLAAKQLGRKAIGIEIEQKYCDIAIERLRQGVLEL